MDYLRAMGENLADLVWKADETIALPQDNALAHRSTVAMAAIQKCGIQLVEHPPCSPDLAPSDYYLFLEVKKELGCHHFARDDDVMNAMDHFLSDQNGVFLCRRDPSAP